MIDETKPAYVRRVRLSSGAIASAVVLTCAALLAIAAAVGHVNETNVEVHVPVSDYIDTSAAITPVSDRRAASTATGLEAISR